ncbi:hypothetical protein [Parasitella parasitica]|uniref:Symplekin/Pta1 N-terminal domain-containing protein n=1 Tax=Parasitella parasitica TaxID=35722 RepID=A0A0B7NQP4_9FUNG|nr:hypothetical protein [Parasitella parasitica]
MEREQQLAQLREFDEEVQSHAENAQSYATKGFLESISQLVEYGLEQEDDGTDNYKEDLKVIKDSIRAFSTVLPILYRTVCQNEAETRLWELTRTLMTLVETKLIEHVNTGVRITAIKCLQVIVLLLSKSSQLRVDHRLLNAQELEKEGNDVFNAIIQLLQSDNESVLTATISCLTVIVKKRPHFAKPVIKAFSTWKSSKSNDDSPVMIRNVEKALKLAFVSLIKTESLSPQRTELISAFGSIGGNVAMFQRHQRAEESRRQKRAAQQQQHDIEREKRARPTEYVPIIPPPTPNILANYDITQIPLKGIVDLCMTVLQTVPLEVMSERVSLLPPEGVTLAVTRPGFVRSTTPPYPPPPDQPQYNTNPRFKTEEQKARQEEEARRQVKLENRLDSDEEMGDSMSAPQPVVYEQDVPEEKPKVQVLASVEERASQSLRMQPYELAKQNNLGQSDKIAMLKMAVQRILQAGKTFQSNVILSDTTKKAFSNGTTTAALPAAAAEASTSTLAAASSTHLSHSQHFWLLLVAKLITRGTNMHYMPVEFKREQQDDDEDTTIEPAEEDDDKKMIMTEDTNADLRELLIDFVAEDFAARNDLALDWLHEEYLLDKRNQRLDANSSPSYFYWFHKFLEKIIPTLDAKDRALTKVMLEAPELDEKTIELIKQNLDSVPDRFVPCLSTLRSLVINRPKARFMALQVLLDLCTHENDKMRRTSIVAVKKWNSNQAEINHRVETFSIGALNELAQEKTEITADEETTWTEKDVVRHAELYFVLCTKRPSLLKELFTVYTQASEHVQKYIRLHMVNMIRSIGMRSQDLIQLVREFPPGGETLVIRILAILCESKPPTREIISVVETISPLAEERSIDLKNLSPILAGQSLSSAAAAADTASLTNNEEITSK